jgi:NADH dehydrogenase
MPANENRLSLLTKGLWQIATREHASLLITGHPDQHMGVEVGLERAEGSITPGSASAPSTGTPADAKAAAQTGAATADSSPAGDSTPAAQGPSGQA